MKHWLRRAQSKKVTKNHQCKLQWLFSAIRSGHIPVLTAVGESPSGQVLCVDSNDAAIRIAHILQPMKVMFLNTTGGLLDSQGNVSDSFRQNILCLFSL